MTLTAEQIKYVKEEILAPVEHEWMRKVEAVKDDLAVQVRNVRMYEARFADIHERLGVTSPKYDDLHARLHDLLAMEQIARGIEAERDELRVALANERGEGEPPSPDWAWHDDGGGDWAWYSTDGRWTVESAPVDDEGNCCWYILRGGSNVDTGAPRTAKTAREGMHAADVARGAT